MNNLVRLTGTQNLYTQIDNNVIGLGSFFFRFVIMFFLIFILSFHYYV